MASEVSICNLALQRLGASRISSLSEDNKNGRACNAAYEQIRDKELRKYFWSFAKKTVILAPDSATPVGWDRQFSLPADWVRNYLVAAAPKDRDEIAEFEIRDRKILVDGTDVLYLTYISKVTDPNKFDVSFIDALYHAIAYQICEPITQSLSKQDGIKADYLEAIALAKQINALEIPAKEFPEDSWISVRV